jgi:hypothetical protein
MDPISEDNREHQRSIAEDDVQKVPDPTQPTTPPPPCKFSLCSPLAITHVIIKAAIISPSLAQGIALQYDRNIPAVLGYL